MIGAFAVLAFTLAAVGIHGLMSFVVSQRTQEFGVRMALGARASAIVGILLRDAAAIAFSGAAVGLCLAYVAARALETMLLGIHPGDPLTFGAAVVVCIVMAMAGTLAPAIRAVRVDPITVLRAD
jgi:putative ABC transport system permease protein